jgi:hypothetical protein
MLSPSSGLTMETARSNPHGDLTQKNVISKQLVCDLVLAAEDTAVTEKETVRRGRWCSISSELFRVEIKHTKTKQ